MVELSRPSESRHLRTFEWSSKDGPTYALVRAVAAELGTDPTSVDPLHDTVNTDAIESMLEGSDSENVTVRIPYQGFTIYLDGAGRGYVYDTEGLSPGATESQPS